MVNILSKYKILKKENVYFLILFFSLLITFEINNFFYLSTEAPDFQHLKNYIKYNFGEINQVDRDMGLAYFNLISLAIKTQVNTITFLNENHMIHNAILISNYLLYVIGLIGLYNLLVLKKFNKSDILFSFIVLSFSPQTINMLITMKPEIFAFSLITWILYFLESYLIDKKTFNLYMLIIPLALLMTTKGSIFFICSFIFAYIILKNYKILFSKKIILPILIFLFLFTGLMFENIQTNGFSIFEHVSSSNDGSYENVADLRILYNINFNYLVTQPFSNFHADSLLGILLLDTFGDYFNFWAYNDESGFVVNKTSIKPFWFVTHYSQMFSIVLTSVFYYLIFYNAKKEKENRIYFLSPVFALLLLIINSFGIPMKNYNPITSDTFKTHYYSFLLAITLVFIILNIVKKNKILKPIIFILIFFSTAYLYGFPKNLNSNFNDYLTNRNSVSTFCVVNSKIINDFEQNNCNNIAYQTCTISRIINHTENIEISNGLFDYKYFYPIALTNEEGVDVGARSPEECRDYISDGFMPHRPFQGKMNLSWINLILYFSSILSFSIFFLFKNKNSEENI